MKKMIYMAVAAIVLLSSCTDNGDILGENHQEGTGVTEFTASIDEVATRTSYNPTDRKAEWLAGDQINVGGAVYTAQTAGATTTFSGSGAVKTGDVYKAYYPASLYSDGTITLPSSYVYDGNFNMPMYAESTTEELNFKNICGVLAITVSSTDISKVNSLMVIGNRRMNGRVRSIDSNGVFTFDSFSPSEETEENMRVSLVFSEPKTITGSETFYIPVPKMSGATLSIAIADDKYFYTMTTKSGAVTITRNNIYHIAFNPDNIHEYAVLAGWKWATENVGEVPGKYNAKIDSCGYYYYVQANDNAQAAAQSWGGTWRLPSRAQWQALIDNCDWTCQTSYVYNGRTVRGMLVSGKEGTAEEGNSIFLPTAGYYWDGFNGVDDICGYYWASDWAVQLYFDYDPYYTKLMVSNETFRSSIGMPVRPVSE